MIITILNKRNFVHFFLCVCVMFLRLNRKMHPLIKNKMGDLCWYVCRITEKSFSSRTCPAGRCNVHFFFAKLRKKNNKNR